MLSSRRNPVRHSLPLRVATSIDSAQKWYGDAIIPAEYFPPKVTKFNAYAIHGVGDKREYSALYPATDAKSSDSPDFHALKYFKEIDFSSLVPNSLRTSMSDLWDDSIDGVFRYKINKLWNGKQSDEKVNVLLKGFQAGVEVNITAPFYNDGDIIPHSTKLDTTGEYEEIELLFLNEKKSYLSIMIGPFGHHLATLYRGANNPIESGLPLDYIVDTLKEGFETLPVSSQTDSYLYHFSSHNNKGSILINRSLYLFYVPGF